MADRPCRSNESGAQLAEDGLSPERFEAVLSSISDGVFTIDLNGIITCFNRAAERITGFSRKEAIGRPCRTILRSDLCKGACALRYTIEKGTNVVDLVVHINSASGQQIPVSISTALFRDKSGKVVGGVETFRDLREVEVLRKEVQQRYTFGDIVSKSQAMRRVLKTLPTIAESAARCSLWAKAELARSWWPVPFTTEAPAPRSPSSRSTAPGSPTP